MDEPHLRLCQLWDAGARPALAEFLAGAGPLSAAQLLAVVRIDQQYRWGLGPGAGVPAEDYLAAHPELAADPELAAVLIVGEYLARRALDAPPRGDYLARFPAHAGPVALQLHLCDLLDSGSPVPDSWMPSTASLTGRAADQASVRGDPTGPAELAPQIPGYEITGLLGRGGMGVVYEARDRELKRTVAIKLLGGVAQLSPALRARFLVEAEVVARLSHPHIVRIHALGETAAGPYLVLEYAAGGSLAQHLSGNPAPPREAAELVRKLAEAVHHAHRHGVIHRDLKPANVLLHPVEGTPSLLDRPNARSAKPPRADGLAGFVPRVADFGLAKRLDETTALTCTDALLGTPSYMAPEQASGREVVGPGADVWALGVILYECLTGRPPFRGASLPETLDLVRHAEPVAPRALIPALPRDLQTIALHCLAKESRRRYATAQELADDLGRFLDHRPIRARPPGVAGRLGRWCRRNPGPAVGAALAASALLLGSAVSFAFARSEAATASRLAQSHETITTTNKALEGTVAELESSNRTNDALRRQADREAAGLALDRGVEHCAAGEVGPGLTWFARALERGARAGDADLEDVSRRQLSAWGLGLPPLRAALGRLLHAQHAAFSADGRRFAVGGFVGGGDPGVWVGSAATGELVGGPFLHPEGVSAVALTADGGEIFTGGHEGELRRLDAVTGRPVGAALPRQAKRITELLVSARGEALFVQAGAAALLDPMTGGRLAALPADVRAPAFTPDGSAFLAALADGTVRSWDAKGQVRPLSLPAGPTTALAASPDATTVLTAGGPRARLWDASTGKPVGDPLEHGAPVAFVAFARGGRLAVTADAGGVYRTWEVASGRPLAVTRSHPAPGQKAIAWTADGVFLTCLHAAELKELSGDPMLWGPAPVLGTPPPIRASGPVVAVGVAGTTPGAANLISAAGTPPVIQKWDRESGRPAGPLVLTRLAGPEGVTGAFAAPGTARLVTVADRTARFWDLTTGTERGTPLAHTARVTGVLFGPGGRPALTVCAGSRLEFEVRPTDLPDGTAGPAARPFGLPNSAVRSTLGKKPATTHLLAVSADGAQIVSSLSGGPIRPVGTPAGLVVTAPGRPARPLALPGSALGVGFSPDGRWLAVGTRGSGAVLCDLAADKLDGQKLTHPGAVLVVAFSPDGGRLLTAGGETARLWHTASRDPVCRPMVHPVGVASAGFTPDGRGVITLGKDGLVRRWDAATGRLIGPPEGDAVACWSVSADGAWLAGGSADGTLRAWPTAPPAAGPPEVLTLATSVLTGLELDPVAAVQPLDRKAWQARVRSLAGTGGPPRETFLPPAPEDVNRGR